MSETKIFGRWSDFQNVLHSFKKYTYDSDYNYVYQELDEPVPTEDELLFASYGGGSYEGDATVIFEKNGELYEVHGSHCSCNGLEGDWGPAKVTWEALGLRLPNMSESQYDGGFLSEHEPEARTYFKKMVLNHVSGQADLDRYNAS
jgi:hypothetical protein